MKVSLIVAMSANRAIGIDNGLPWHLSADLRRFKALTMGKPILMGRKTHESIGRVLPGRINIILTRDMNYDAPGCVVVHSLDEAMACANPVEELMVIGGASLYERCLPHAHRLYMTCIDAYIEGDTFFPDWKAEGWNEIERENVLDDASVPFTYRFIVLERNLPAA